MKKILLTAALAVIGTMGAKAQVLITQYYEGPSTNKWIEITNVGGTSFDLSTLALGQWNNASAEGYKTGAAPTFTMTLTGTLAAGSSYVIGNTGNTTPSYAVANATNNSVINFNGNDSLVLYTAGTFSLGSIVDAIGFTNAGNEGVDKSFVRITTGIGWNTTTGSDATEFAAIWGLVALADVNSASAGTDNYLGYSSLAAVPEPSTYALVGMGLFGLMVLRRMKKA